MSRGGGICQRRRPAGEAMWSEGAVRVQPTKLGTSAHVVSAGSNFGSSQKGV